MRFTYSNEKLFFNELYIKLNETIANKEDIFQLPLALVINVSLDIIQ